MLGKPSVSPAGRWDEACVLLKPPSDIQQCACVYVGCVRSHLARLVDWTRTLDKASSDCHAEHSVHLSYTYSGKSCGVVSAGRPLLALNLWLFRKLWPRGCSRTWIWWVSPSATSPHCQRSWKAKGTVWLQSWGTWEWLLSSQREATSCLWMFHLLVSYSIQCCSQNHPVIFHHAVSFYRPGSVPYERRWWGLRLQVCQVDD